MRRAAAIILPPDCGRTDGRMEPATLYILLKIQNGPEIAKQYRFASMSECEEVFNTRIKSWKVEIIHHSCEEDSKHWKPPKWYSDHFAQKVERHINGVPLDPKYVPPNRP